MNMIKCVRKAIVLAFALCIGSANAEYYLSWRIDNSSPFEFVYATVKATGANGYSEYLVSTSTEGLGGSPNFFADSYPGTSAAGENGLGLQAYGTGNPTDYSSYNFQVQLWGLGESGDGELLAASTAASWGDLVTSFNCLNSAVEGTKGDGVWVVSGFHAVPEPTSGMLFLLGLASLALRRKRVEG